MNSFHLSRVPFGDAQGDRWKERGIENLRAA